MDQGPAKHEGFVTSCGLTVLSISQSVLTALIVSCNYLQEYRSFTKADAQGFFDLLLQL